MTKRLSLMRRMIRYQALCLAGALCVMGARASGDGASVVVLVNSASADSESVGLHYAKLRQVPAANICRIRCTTSEVISRRRFNTDVRQPLREFLVKNGLARETGPNGPLALSVKYLVSTYGVPVKIREDYSKVELKDLPRKAQERNAAAVDSELSLIAESEYPLEGMRKNPLYKAPDAARHHVLFATRLDGPSPEIARALVDSALHAERHGLFGIGYVDATGSKSAPYNVGDQWMFSAGAALKASGFFTRVDRAGETFPADMPMPQAAFYFGWYRPALCGPMARKNFRFPPGAVAYHLHSGSAARLRTTRIGWAGPLLARGAGATMGAVFEPFLTGSPDVGEFARLFLAGRTFGESAYRATTALSWMMTYVGDPLYAPFRAERRAAALERPENRRWRDMHDAIAAARKGEIETALAICARRGSEPLFVEMDARVKYQSGRPAEAMTAYRRLAGMVKDEYSSIQQHAVVGDWLVSSGKASAAMNAYVECIRAHPRSPHAVPIYRKALRLAKGLRSAKTEVALWHGLAVNFPHRALGRFAAGELWGRGLWKECPVPRLQVPQTDGRPTIDGLSDDLAWKGAAEITDLPYLIGPRRVNQGGRVRLIYDKSALYVLAEVHSNAGYPAPYGPMVLDEAFELMLSPWRDAQRAVKLSFPKKNGASVPVRGAVWRTGVLRAQQGPVKVEVGWLVELEIPFRALGLKEAPKNARWAANFVRKCYVPKFPFRVVPSAASWAPADADPLAPECAGYLMFK